MVPAGMAQQAQHGYRISGVVVDAGTGTPVTGAEVFITVEGEEIVSTTGEDGRFFFPGLTAAKYVLSATARGYVRELYEQHGPYSTGIAVGNGLDSEHLVFRLHKQAVITGKVTDEHGEAVRQAEVILIGIENASGAHGRSEQTRIQTNDLGEYRFAHLQPGRYYVAAAARPWYAQMGLSDVLPPVQDSGPDISVQRGPRTDPLLDVVYPITFYPSVTNEQAAVELNPAPGETREADLQMRAVPAIHVHLTNLPTGDDGQITIEAHQRFFGSLDEPLNPVFGQRTPGEYELAGLPPGEVTLIVSQSGNQGTSSQTLKTNLRGGEALDGAVRGATAKVTGRVIFPSGDENSGQGQVSLQSENELNAVAPLQKDGTFFFAGVQADTYRVLVASPGGDVYVERISATGAEIHGREITITGAGDVQLSIAVGKARGQLTGLAKLDGKPAAGMMVLLVPESGENLEEDSRLDQSDSDGTFALADIHPGKYKLMAIEDGWELERNKWDALKPYLEKGQSLQISGSEQKKVTVEVQRKKQ
jgi:hypothetical protein